VQLTEDLVRDVEVPHACVRWNPRAPRSLDALFG
jgi:hypothetical protein